MTTEQAWVVTVYVTEDVHDGEGSHRQIKREVVTGYAENPIAFQAHLTKAHAPGMLVEFGPIGRPWSKQR